MRARQVLQTIQRLKESVILQFWERKDAEITYYPEFTVGSILCAKHGYTTTDYVFYELVRRTNSTAWVRQLRSKIVDSQGNPIKDNPYEGYKMPIIGQYASDRLESGRIKDWNAKTPCIKVGYNAYAILWDGQPQWFNTLD